MRSTTGGSVGIPVLQGREDVKVRFAWSSKTASQYLYLWKKRGLIQALGGHSDVFCNSLKAPKPNWWRAAHMAMPTAVVAGLESLRMAGWSTQIPIRPILALSNKRPIYSTEHFDILPRPPAWFEAIKDGVQRTEDLPVLRPSWALADILAHEGG